MKHLFSILTICISLSAFAQETVINGPTLNFDQPNFVANGVFDVLKYRLSSEGRKQWKPEFTLRWSTLAMDSSGNITAGIRTSPNKVFGIGAGLGQMYTKGNTLGDRVSFYLYHRHYIPLGPRKRVYLYSDIMGGGRYIYHREVWYAPRGANPKNDVWGWYFSWQPGVAIRMFGKSNIFVGLCFGPTYGGHVGITI